VRRLAGLLAAVAAGAALSAGPARADVRIDGHGWGHGIGLAQYGAYGYALNEGRDFRFILDHYFPGTTLGPSPARRIRVRLKEGGTLRLCSAGRMRDARGRLVRLSELRTYAFAPWEADGIAVTDTTTRRRRARLRAPVRISGGQSTCLRGKAENGRTNGTYRGAMVVLRAGNRLLAVNDVSLRAYLWGVVPAEVPASWPAEALKAQAVAARGYAVRALKPVAPFDVLADTRSQVYGGADSEAPATTAAVDATEPLVVMYGGEVAATYFSSSSGGRTAAIEEVFTGSPPVPYLQSVDDPHDTLSPYHDWTVTLTDEQAQRKLDEVLDGDLVGIEVAAFTPSGRAAIVRVTGTEGARDVAAGTIRTLLGLRSTWFEISRPEPEATPPA
jgi:stage II sporulation protein D